MKNLILIAFAAILFCGCKKDADPATLIVGKWQLIKQTSEYYENGVLTDPPPPSGPIAIDTTNITFTDMQFNHGQNGTENYNVAQAPFAYTLSNNQLNIVCPHYYYQKHTDYYDPLAVTYVLGFSGTYQATVTKVSLTLFSSGTIEIDTNKTVTVNKTMYFSRE